MSSRASGDFYCLAEVLQWVPKDPRQSWGTRAIIVLPFPHPDCNKSLAYIVECSQDAQVTNGWYCVGFTDLEDDDSIKKVAKQLRPKAVERHGKVA